MFSKSGINPLQSLGLRSQLVLFFLLVFGGIFAAFATGTFLYVERLHREEFDAALYNYVVDVSHSMPPHLAPGAPAWEPTWQESELLLPFSRNRGMFQVMDENGRVLLKTRNLGTRVLPPIRVDAASGERRRYRDAGFAEARLTDAPDGRVRMVARPYEYQGKRYIVQLAAPTFLVEQREESFLWFLCFLVPLSLCLAGWAGHALSRRAMGPVAAITQKANAIEVQDLSQRIPVPTTRDEIRELATTLNGLLDRLELAFKSQETFVADASHQLKTPLSILKGELDVFRRQGSRSPEQTTAMLDSLVHEVGSLERLVGNLLMLAYADSRQIERSPEQFDFGERVLETVARVKRLPGPPRQILVNLHPEDESSPSFEMSGDPELCRALVENLLDNALKYTPPEGKVHVALRARGSEMELTVSDEGPGFDPDGLKLLFDRFYRAPGVRTVIDGSGLGLAIVRRVVMLHGGRVRGENGKKGGAVVTVVLPRTA